MEKVEYLLIDLFSPIQDIVDSDDPLAALIAEIDINIELNPTQSILGKELFSVGAEIEKLLNLRTTIASGNFNLEEFNQTIQNITSKISALINISPETTNKLLQMPEPINDPKFFVIVAEQIANKLFSSWLERNFTAFFDALVLTGILVKNPYFSKAGYQFSWDNLLEFVANPIIRMQKEYNWGGALDHYRLMTNLVKCLHDLNIHPHLDYLNSTISDKYFQGTNASNVTVLKMPLIDIAESVDYGTGGNLKAALKLSALLMAAPKNSGKPITGFLITNESVGEIKQKFDLGNEWILDISTNADLNGAIGLNIQPDGITFEQKDIAINCSMSLEKAYKIPKILFGKEKETRLELSGLSFNVEADISTTEQELIASIILGNEKSKGLKLVIVPKEDDAFLKQIIGKEPKEISIDPSIFFSTKNGFSMPGLADNTIVLPLNLSLGPIKADELVLKLKAKDGEVKFTTQLSLTADFELLALIVKRVGLSVAVKKLPENDYSGLLGNVDLGMALVPPEAVGIVFKNPEILSGGGYLEYNEALSQYSGGGEVKFKEIGLTIIGILTTKIENHPGAWSLYLNVFGTFSKIQLGYGFALKGVGGLFCFNQSLDEEALRAKMIGGTLDSLLFPVNPTENIKTILADIRSVFPIRKDCYVFGAMFKIVWGEPELIDIDLALALELPALKAYLLGQLEARLPNKKKPIVFLNLDVFGVANFTEGSLKLDAVLRNSYVLDVLKLSGSMALRAQFKNQPNFLLAIGGFHPSFNPPANFPKLSPITAYLEIDKFAKVNVACYLALTSNTVQFGGRLDFFVDFKVLTVTGYAELDTLIQFSPFLFTVDVGFGAKIYIRPLKVHLTVDVAAHIEGPSPMKIGAKVKCEVFGIYTYEEKINLKIGNEISTAPVDRVSLKEKIAIELKAQENWKTVSINDTLSLLKVKPVDGLLLPSANIQFKQKFSPIHTKIQCIGASNLQDLDTLNIESFKIGTKLYNHDELTLEKEWFAPAQFYKITNEEEKIKAPSFEALFAGFSKTVDTITYEGEAAVSVEHEESIIDLKLNAIHKSTKKAFVKTKSLSDKVKHRALYKKAAQNHKVKPTVKLLSDAYLVASQEIIASGDYKNLKTYYSYFEATILAKEMNARIKKAEQKVKVQKIYA